VTTGFPAIASLHPAGEVCASRVPPQIAWTVARERGRERERDRHNRQKPRRHHHRLVCRSSFSTIVLLRLPPVVTDANSSDRFGSSLFSFLSPVLARFCTASKRSSSSVERGFQKRPFLSFLNRRYLLFIPGLFFWSLGICSHAQRGERENQMILFGSTCKQRET
jgi:hypothetical protein